MADSRSILAANSLDHLIRVARDVTLVDDARPNWTVTVSSEDDQPGGMMRLSIAIDSRDQRRVDEMVRRVRFVRTPWLVTHQRDTVSTR